MAKQVADVRAGRTMLGQAGWAFQNTPALDSQLIVQIGQRNEQALGALYDRFSALVYTLALQITHDRALAETIVVDVFYAVWELASSFQIGASVPAWMIGITRRRAIEVAQPQAARTRTPSVARPETHTIDGKQIERMIHVLTMPGLLDTLPAEVRETLELAYYDGLTCREIATRLHEPLSTITIRLRSGLCTLSDALSNVAENLGEQKPLSQAAGKGNRAPPA